MPTQNQPIEPSAFRELQRRVERLENENQRDAGRKLITVDRLTTANLPAPSEGQIAVEHSSDDLKYYANSQWRSLGSGPYGFDTSHDLMWPFCISSNSGLSTGWTYTDNFGTNRFNQYYIEHTTLNKYVTGIVRLGPKGSVWDMSLVARRNTDCGQITMQLGTLSEDNAYGVNTNGGAANGIGALEDVDDAPITFYDLPRDGTVGGGADYADLYNGSLVDYGSSAQFIDSWRFRIMGDDGATLTAISDNNQADGTHVEVNGGAGMYAVRLKITGKNASSSGYRARIHYWNIRRVTGSLLTT